VQSFRAHFPRQSLLVNGLGPTECTLALQYFIDEATVIDQATVPVGYPVEGVRIRLVTPLGEQVAPWGTGQVEIESSALALGYWKRPELTAKAFLPGPAGQETRVYRTGDLGRMRPDGAIEYLGRIDHQVKVRGHRIELGEIEAAILASGEVAEVVVALRASSSGEERLTAYLVPLPGRSPALEALRKALALTLPSVMIPSSFLVLPALPLLPNGKVALRALPSPAPRSAEAGAPARDDLEAQIEAMFRALLGVDRIGPNESFFDLGGHSMLAVTLIEQLHRRFGVRLSLLSLFEAQTVEALAALLRKGGAPPRDHVLVPIRALGRLRPLFLISRPNVNSLGYLALARALDPARPVFGLQRECPEEHELGRPFLHEEYRAWAQAYLTTIRAVQPKGPYLLGGMCEGALIAFTMTRLLEAEGEEVALLAMFDAWPEENTRRRLLHQVFLYQKSLRESLDEGLPTLARRLVHKAARALRRGRLDDEAAANRALWNERIFPGPDFVPPRVNAPIAVFAVDEQPYWRVRDESLGWASRTRAPVRIHRVEGDHRTLLRDPHVASLARALDAELRRADEASPRRSDGSAPSPHEGPGSPGPPPTVITTVNDLRRALT
jgi:thioesterase domain-containing protein/acyl carrier protein